MRWRGTLNLDHWDVVVVIIVKNTASACDFEHCQVCFREFAHGHLFVDLLKDGVVGGWALFIIIRLVVKEGVH